MRNIQLLLFVGMMHFVADAQVVEPLHYVTSQKGLTASAGYDMEYCSNDTLEFKGLAAWTEVENSFTFGLIDTFDYKVTFDPAKIQIIPESVGSYLGSPTFQTSSVLEDGNTDGYMWVRHINGGTTPTTFEFKAVVLGSPSALSIELDSAIIIGEHETISGDLDYSTDLTLRVESDSIYDWLVSIPGTIISPGADVDVSFKNTRCIKEVLLKYSLDSVNFTNIDTIRTEFHSVSLSNYSSYWSGNTSFTIPNSFSGYLVLNAVDPNSNFLYYSKVIGSNLSVNELHYSTFDVFQNTSSKNINVVLKEDSGVKLIKVTDISGKLIRTIDVEANHSMVDLNLSPLSSGIYFIQPISNKAKIRFKPKKIIL